MKIDEAFKYFSVHLKMKNEQNFHFNSDAKIDQWKK
jgi:hypothetical protein